ncbi:MAG: pyridoxal phosphate-dependent aminotransferase [Candidatus Asgardarchaeia archaeon]
MKELSPNALNLPESGTIKILEMSKSIEKNGFKVYHLDVGEPMFDTPDIIKNAAIEAIRKGYTKYCTSKGILDLRKNIISKYNEKLGTSLNPDENIVITPGAKFAIYAAILSVLDRNEEMAILTPTWVSYWAAAKFVGATINEIDAMGRTTDIFEEKIKDALSKRTKLLIVNSPNNPTGHVLTEQEMKLIRDLSIDYDFYILSDEIYDFLAYDVTPHSFLEFQDIFDRLIIINGFSKKYAMTGWRLGYAVAPKSIIDLMVKIQQAATTSPTTFVQYAALSIYENWDLMERVVSDMIRQYTKNKELTIKLLSEIDGVTVKPPQGAFYAFPDISTFEKNSEKFVKNLLMAQHVSVTPGSIFGKGGEGHIRISFAASEETIREGISRIKEFIKNYN